MSTCSEWFRHVFRKGKLQAPNALQCAALPAFGFASEAAGWVSTQTSCLEKQHVTFDQHLPLNCCNEITMFDDSIYLNYDLL